MASFEAEHSGAHVISSAATPPTLGRGGKKGDIYRLGLTLLSLAQGRQVSDKCKMYMSMIQIYTKNI